jgi:hypothetical protein
MFVELHEQLVKEAATDPDPKIRTAAQSLLNSLEAYQRIKEARRPSSSAGLPLVRPKPETQE